MIISSCRIGLQRRIIGELHTGSLLKGALTHRVESGPREADVVAPVPGGMCTRTVVLFLLFSSDAQDFMSSKKKKKRKRFY